MCFSCFAQSGSSDVPTFAGSEKDAYIGYSFENVVEEATASAKKKGSLGWVVPFGDHCSN